MILFLLNKDSDTDSDNKGYFDYDNLDVSDYDFSEEKLAKTIGSQQCHLCCKYIPQFNYQYIWDESIKLPNLIENGICPLHCRIRSMEWLFGVGVNIKVSKNNSNTSQPDKLKEAK